MNRKGSVQFDVQTIQIKKLIAYTVLKKIMIIVSLFHFISFIYIIASLYFKRPCGLSNSILLVQWNLVIKRSDITKPSYNKVILLVPALSISLFFYPDIMRNLI